MYDRVLVPVDGSDCSIAAAREAAVVADVCDARVRLAHVLSRSAVRGEGVDPETADEAALRELAADALDDAERSSTRRASRPTPWSASETPPTKSSRCSRPATPTW
ncbi:universal stress protein [Haloplanus sp. GCM10025708]|uniref:universal stress protein n=1 Tax=Haloplanus sp. GCM10025708 TaxID=3252679 RepID=UPI00361D6AB3